MPPDPDPARAIAVLDDFAARTGLTGDGPPRRYLWTDAFAVCTWLGLHERTGERRLADLATALIDQVHGVLGRHHPDDERSGWISGASEAEGAAHPTAGGLRIGKPQPERGPDGAYDPQAEWDRDGQYYHYLTKWMFALNRAWRVTGDATYHRQGVELARAANAAFIVDSPGGPRLVWKMSADLSRALVASSGHHDPLDGLVTASGLVATRPAADDAGLLDSELRALRSLCRGASWVTEDPLGIGGLLVDALRCAQLAGLGHPTGRELLGSVLADGRRSLESAAWPALLGGGSEQRLAFRELGLALGLEAVERLGAHGMPTAVGLDPRDAAAVRAFTPLGARILNFWAQPSSRRARTWGQHRDISEVMWATCLAPEGFLDL